MIQLDDLRRRKAAILQLAAKYGIQSVRVFGSAANGQAGATSDVDLLVDFRQGRSLLDQVGFEQEVADLLGCPVDVIAEGGISPYLEKRILEDAVPL
jgi:predicted nucleotidyltransferase